MESKIIAGFGSRADVGPEAIASYATSVWLVQPTAWCPARAESVPVIPAVGELVWSHSLDARRLTPSVEYGHNPAKGGFRMTFKTALGCAVLFCVLAIIGSQPLP